jgi:DNA-binding transcriptional regulator YdaS (Cro superfamily)
MEQKTRTRQPDPTVRYLVKRASRITGSLTALTQALGISKAAPHYWKQIPAHHVLAIEAATGGKMTRHALRPDLYPGDQCSGILNAKSS